MAFRFKTCYGCYATIPLDKDLSYVIGLQVYCENCFNKIADPDVSESEKTVNTSATRKCYQCRKVFTNDNLAVLLCGGCNFVVDGRESQVGQEFGFDSPGEDHEYASGAVREQKVGKGRYDLLSPEAIRRLAVVLEKGAARYGDRNWERGLPRWSLLDSALRHTFQLLAGEYKEDHAAHAVWNLMALIHLEDKDD